MKSLLKRRAADLGFDAFQVTSANPPQSAKFLTQWLDRGDHGEMAYLAKNAVKRITPDLVLPGARSILCLATSYHRPYPGSRNCPKSKETPHQGIVARYARYEDYHQVLGERLKTFTAFLDTLAGVTRKSLWYVDTGPILERDLAQRAGLGFAGKHTNLISRSLGNWFLLSEILTLAEIEPDAPEKNRCGKCERCIHACPTGAITAPFTLDARRCISYLTIELKGSIPTELRPLIGNRIFGCDDCLAACPWNRFARQGSMLAASVRHDLVSPNLVDLLQLDEQGFRVQFRNSPFARSKRRGLLRNVCVALGNVGNEADLPHLEKARSDREPLVAEHATWAIQQIKSRAPLA